MVSSGVNSHNSPSKLFLAGDLQQNDEALFSNLTPLTVLVLEAFTLCWVFPISTSRHLETQCSHSPYGWSRVLDSRSDHLGLWSGRQTLSNILVGNRLLSSVNGFTGVI
jgi:hypothetical protein